MEIAPRGLARDPEFFCCLFLFQTFQIDEPYQLDLIGLEQDSLPFILRAAAGLVTTGFRGSGYSAPEPWPSPAGTLMHLIVFIRWHYLLLFIVCIWNSITCLPDEFFGIGELMAFLDRVFLDKIFLDDPVGRGCPGIFPSGPSCTSRRRMARDGDSAKILTMPVLQIHPAEKKKEFPERDPAFC
jgi:hypothetical protein